MNYFVYLCFLFYYWNFKLDDYINNSICNQKNQHITYSKNIRHIFYFCKDFNHFKVNPDDILCKNKDNNDENSDNFSLISIRFSPDGKNLAIGDSIGNVIIYSLITFEQITSIPIHSGDVNSIDMIKDIDNNKLYLSTGGDDNCISLLEDYDSNNIIIEKLDSPVINVAFCIDKNKNLKLMIAEQYSTIIFFYK